MLIFLRNFAQSIKAPGSYVLKTETATKGIEQNLRDGGWFQFKSVSDSEMEQKQSMLPIDLKNVADAFNPFA